MTDLLFSRASRRSWLKQGTALSLAAAGSLRVWAQPQQTTLVLGDQAGGLRSLFEASRTLEGAPFAYRWANFQGAAPLFEAQRSAAVDTAVAGDLPVLAAAVGRTPLKIVATRVGKADALGIVVQPDSPLQKVADLRGKTVIVSSARGSISQYQLYGALEEAGVRRDEVTVKFVLPTDAAAAFASKQIDAWAVFDPYYTIALQQGGRILRDGRGINTALGFITARRRSFTSSRVSGVSGQCRLTTSDAASSSSRPMKRAPCSSSGASLRRPL